MNPRGEFALFATSTAKELGEKICHCLEEIVVYNYKALQNRAWKELSLQERKVMEFGEQSEKNCGLKLEQYEKKHFGEGEMDPQIMADVNVRDKDVFIVHHHFTPDSGNNLNENLMESCLFASSLKFAGAAFITLIMPYYPYARGDKQHAKDGIPAAFVAKMFETACIDRIITMDLHADQIIGFFNPKLTKVEHMYASPLIIHKLKEVIGENKEYKIGGPDPGAAKKGTNFARKLNVPLIMGYKTREHATGDLVLKILGNVKGYHIAIVDDIVGTGGTIEKVIDCIAEYGALDIIAACTFATLVGNGVERMQRLYDNGNGPLKLLIGTDAIPQPNYVKYAPWYCELTISKLIAQAIYEIHTSGSVSQLYKPESVDEFGLWISDST
ncbi:MAG: ribose-phosphate pyrophosphokinase [Candidatus Coatesbacteria bacterium]|nr:ribose-phosphate pyrophosphokinase [Candidatus Coatesbacteria bacterium]